MISLFWSTYSPNSESSARSYATVYDVVNCCIWYWCMDRVSSSRRIDLEFSLFMESLNCRKLTVQRLGDTWCTFFHELIVISIDCGRYASLTIIIIALEVADFLLINIRHENNPSAEWLNINRLQHAPTPSDPTTTFALWSSLVHRSSFSKRIHLLQKGRYNREIHYTFLLPTVGEGK